MSALNRDHGVVQVAWFARWAGHVMRPLVGAGGRVGGGCYRSIPDEQVQSTWVRRFHAEGSPFAAWPPGLGAATVTQGSEAMDYRGF